MKAFQLIFLLFAIILFSQCHKTKPYVPVQLCPDLTENINSVEMFIYKKWEWTESRQIDRSGTTIYSYPKVEGYSLQLKLTSDTAIFYKNNFPDVSYKFRVCLEKEITNDSSDDKTVIVMYDLTSGSYHHYYRIQACENFLVLLQSYRSDISPDMIYKK
jgi:hypothetical protein